MKQILRQIHNYLRRKLKELQPEFVSITIFVPGDVHRDLVDEYQLGDRSVANFVEGDWPDETSVSFTPIPEEGE